MDKLSSLMVLLSLVTTNIYIADSYTLTASVLNQLGYNTQSTGINIIDANLEKIDPNAFNGYDNLTYIRLDYGITTLDAHTFERLSNLLELDLRFNLLTSLVYLQIPKNLKELRLSSNNMNYFALSRTMGVLDRLDISFNRFRSFKSMDFTFLANLTFLSLSNNPHAYPNEISGHLKPLVKLDYVDLANLSINSIDSNFFKTNTKLQFINLSQNKISNLDNRSFTGLNDIQTINLNDNNLTKIASGTFRNPSLTGVDLTNNQISQIESSSFYGIAKITVLLDFTIFLYNNQLTKIPPRIFEGQFQNIDLRYNQITEIDSLSFDGISRVRNIFLENNKIEKIKTGSFNFEIGSLFLMNNHLTQLVNGSFLGQITEINLWNNTIEKIEKGAFNYGNITYLSLGCNNLTEITNTMFSGPNQLKYIGLDYNAISKIETGSFANLPNLRGVYLGNNQLTQLDSSMFAGSNNLETISLTGNPNLSTANIQSLCPPAATQCQVYY